MKRIRQLEAASLGASAFLAVATYLTVSTGSAVEANPLVAALIGSVPWFALAGVKLLAVVGAFAVFRRVDSIELDGVDSSRIATGGAVATTALLFANVANDFLILVETFPDTFLVGSTVGFSAVTAGVCFVLLARNKIVARMAGGFNSLPERKALAAVGMVFLVAFSPMTGLAIQTDTVGSVDSETAFSWTEEYSDTSEGGAIGFIPGKNYVVEGAPFGGSATVYNASDGYSSVTSISVQEEIRDIQATKDHLVVTDVYNVRVHTNASGFSEERVISFSNIIGEAHINPANSSEMVVRETSGSTFIVNLETGNKLRSTSLATGGGVKYHPDGDVFAAVDDNNDAIDVFYSSNLSSKKTISTSSHIGSIGRQGVAFSPNGDYIMVGDGGGNWEVLNYDTGATLDTGSTGSNKIMGIQFSPDGSYFGVAPSGESLHVYDWNGSGASLNTTKVNKGTGENDVAWGDNRIGHSGGDGVGVYTAPDVSASSSGSGSTVSGVVTDQNGNPVPNATVRVTGVDYSALSTSDLEARADELLDEAEDPRPSSWDPELAPVDEIAEPADSLYVSTYTPSGAGVNNPVGDSKLAAEWTVHLDASEPVVFTVRDPNKGGLLSATNAHDRDLPGNIIRPDAPVTLYQLDAAGDTVRTITVPIDETKGGTVTDEMEYGEKRLSPGFYAVVPPNASAPQSTIVVGDPSEIVAEMSRELRNEAGQLTEKAKDIRERFESGKFTSTRVTTDANGEFTASVGSNVETVSITAYRVPQGMDPNETTRADIREYYNAMVFSGADPSTSSFPTGSLDGGLSVEYRNSFDPTAANASNVSLSEVVPAFYLPADAERVDVPGPNATVNVYKTSTPRFANSSALTNRSNWLENALQNATFGELPPALQSYLNNTNQSLSQVRDRLHNVTKQNEWLKQRYKELLADDRNVSVAELEKQLQNQTRTSEELREEILALRQAIATMDNTVTVEPPDVEKSGDTVSLAWGVPMDLDAGNVSVMAHYANGTSRVVPGEYVAVDTSPIGDDTVRVEQYPLGSADPASVQFELLAANAEDTAKRSDSVKNPTFKGSLPRIDSIVLSSVTPGPNENVSLTVDPSDAGSFKRVTGATVYAPDGSELGTSPVSDGRTVSFTTSGAGVHHIALSMETTGGESVEIPVRIRTYSQDVERPPTLSLKDSPVGEYVLASGEFDGAEITTENAGQRATVTAILPGDTDDVPSNMHVHLEEVAIPSSAETTIQLVRGEEERSVDQSVPVSIHFKSPAQSDVLVYRNGAPVPAGEGNAKGARRTTGSALVVETVTDSSGSVTVSKQTNPSFLDRVGFAVAQLLNGPLLAVSFPVPASVPVDTAGTLAASVAAPDAATSTVASDAAAAVGVQA
jgi:hypothetical protein